jgi:hypothetical protein
MTRCCSSVRVGGCRSLQGVFRTVTENPLWPIAGVSVGSSLWKSAVSGLNFLDPTDVLKVSYPLVLAFGSRLGWAQDHLVAYF